MSRGTQRIPKDGGGPLRCQLTREDLRPLRTNIHELFPLVFSRLGPLRNSKVMIPRGNWVSKIKDTMQERDWSENILELERMGHKLCLDNGVGYCPLASNAMVKDEGLCTFCLGLVWLKHGRSLHLWTIMNYGLNDRVHLIHLRWYFLEVVLETLSLEESRESYPLIWGWSAFLNPNLGPFKIGLPSMCSLW